MPKLRQILEKSIELASVKAIQKRWPTVIIRKLNGPGARSWPDRVFLFPRGVVVFIEFKRLGANPTPQQWHQIKQLRENGYATYICHSKEEAIGFCETYIAYRSAS